MSNRVEPGGLIVFEGPDGAGKSTLARCVVDRLRESGIRSEYAAFPGRQPGTIGQVVYEIHHDPGRFGIEQLSPTCLQALHIAAHLDAIERAILPALSEGTWIILDRYWWSTWVYGCVAGADRNALDAMIAVERAQWAGTQPDVVFLVDRPDSPAYKGSERLRDAYRTLYDSERNSYPVQTIQNDSTVADTACEIITVLDDLVGGIRATADWVDRQHEGDAVPLHEHVTES